MDEVMQHAAPAAPIVSEIPKRKVKRKIAKRKPLRKRNGFSLLELVVVVAIIGIIVAVALPQFTQALTNSKNKAGAAETRSVITALNAYAYAYNVSAPTLTALGGATTCDTGAPATAAAACLLPSPVVAALATPGIDNYTFTMTPGTTPAWILIATPVPGSGAVRSFYADSNGSFTYSDTGAATATSTLVGN